MAGQIASYRNYCDSQSGVYPPDDFEGLRIEHWDNGQVKFRGAYEKGGMRVGQHISFWENGVLQEVSYWEQGWVTGTVLWFREDGSKEYEKDYGDHGSRTRSWIERYYSASDVITFVRAYKADEVVSEWTRPDLREIEEEMDVDSIVDKAVKRFFPETEQ